jgi:Fic family protein
MAIFDTPEIDSAERTVLAQIDGLREQVGYLLNNSPKRWQGGLRRSLFARAIRGSNSIEGYKINVSDAIAAVAQEEPLEATELTWKEIVGYRQAMTCVLHQVTDRTYFRLSTDWIKALHYMMLQHDGSKNPGKWRPGVIYVRDEEKKLIVYEGPDATLVPGLMEELTASVTEPSESPAMVRAAMGHLNLVMIHPFSDGNGRMARCLQTLILGLSGTLAPEFSSIEEYLGRNTERYYDMLAQVGSGSWHPERDARPWVRFCLTAHVHQAMTVLARSREQQKLAARLEDELTHRGLPDRLVLGLLDAAFNHMVRNGTYRAITELSAQVATRDLGLAVEAGYLEPHGENRGRYYAATPLLRQMRIDSEEPKTFPDPFAAESVSQPRLQIRDGADTATATLTASASTIIAGRPRAAPERQ